MIGRGIVPGRHNLIAAGLIAIIAVVTFFNALQVASSLAQTSDSAQGFVVGHAIANGNVLLSGWRFPIDNFYFTDSIPYAAAEAMAGSRPNLMTVVPALVYAGLVLLALVLCVRPKRSFGTNLVSLAAGAVVLAAPAWIGIWNPMLMSNMHTATTVAALAALALFAWLAAAQSIGAIGRLVPALAFLLAAFTVASDPFSLVFAFGPAVAVLAIEAARKGHLPKVRFTLALLAATIIAGLLLPSIIARIGGFTTESDVAFAFAPAAQWGTNLIDVVFGILTLWGSNPLDVQSVSVGLMFTIRCAVPAFVLFALGCVAGDLLRSRRLDLLDRLLCVGAAVSLVACMSSVQFAKGVKPETMLHGGPPMRFLVPAFLFVSILACRKLAGALERLPNSGFQAHSARAMVVVAVLLIGAQQFASTAATPQSDNSNPELTVAHWLAQHRLSEGAGEYWSANLLTAISGNRIGVRSMVAERGALVPYLWVEAQNFYARPPQFGVWKEPNHTGWTEAAVRATWPVCAIRTVAGYRIALLQTSEEFTPCSPP